MGGGGGGGRRCLCARKMTRDLQSVRDEFNPAACRHCALLHAATRLSLVGKSRVRTLHRRRRVTASSPRRITPRIARGRADRGQETARAVHLGTDRCVGWR